MKYRVIGITHNTQNLILKMNDHDSDVDMT